MLNQAWFSACRFVPLRAHLGGKKYEQTTE